MIREYVIKTFLALYWIFDAPIITLGIIILLCVGIFGLIIGSSIYSYRKSTGRFLKRINIIFIVVSLVCLIGIPTTVGLGLKQVSHYLINQELVENTNYIGTIENMSVDKDGKCKVEMGGRTQSYYAEQDTCKILEQAYFEEKTVMYKTYHDHHLLRNYKNNTIPEHLLFKSIVEIEL